MNIQDPIADLLTRIRNAQSAMHVTVMVPFSKVKEGILRVFCEEGYIQSYSVHGDKKREIEIELKYYRGKPVINTIKRISHVGLRVYRNAEALKDVPGFGVAVVSTSKGIMSHPNAKKLGVGGEVLCEVA